MTAFYRTPGRTVIGICCREEYFWGMVIYRHVCFMVVNDILQAAGELKRKGIQIRLALQNVSILMSSGLTRKSRNFYGIYDPEGNEIEFMQI